MSPPPLVVEQATIDAYRLVNQNPDRTMWSNLDLALPETKAELAELVDCDPGEIALNRNSTEGLCTAIFGISLAAGDQVVVSHWDYPSVRAAWFQRQEREGIEVVTADYDLMDSDEEIFDAYAAVLTPRTRVLQITHMSHWTGRVVPDCDFFITSLHKWMGAPIGNGMLVVREGVIDRTWPLPAPFDPPPLRVDKFDHWNLGTYNSALQAGILPAARFHREIGARAVHARVRELTRYWVERAGAIPGFRLHTPLDTETLGAVSLFSVDGLDARAVEQELRDEHQVYVKYREVRHLSGMRVSPHIYMRERELDRFVDALAEVVGKRRAGRS